MTAILWYTLQKNYEHAFM